MTEIFIFLVGIFVGMMNAIAGGGMLVGFPALLAAGLSPLVATATTPIVVLPGQLTAAGGYRKYLKKIPRYYMWLLLPCILGAAIGATLLRNITHSDFDELVPLLIFFAVILFAAQPFLHFHLKRDLSRKQRNTQTLVLLCVGLLPVSIYAGFFGPGFGFIMLAFLSFSNLHDIHKMNALKSIAGFAIAVTALLCLTGAGLIDWELGLIMATGTAIGGYAGSRVSQRFTTHAIRIGVIVIGLASAAYLAARAYHQ
jgi:uncharacterized membrane protein YfcA